MKLPMTWTRWAMVVYAVAMAVFGTYGTLASPSKEVVSLIAGVAVAVVTLALMAWSRSNPRVAYSLALLVGMLVMANGFATAARKGAFYPQGVVGLMSLTLVLCLVTGHLIAMFGPKSDAPA